MCGIAGIVNFNGAPVSDAELRLMTNAIRHRGPNGEGIYTNGSVGLGHRRLSVIDLSANGRQPMRYKHLVLSYNGEIYNYLELRAKLVALGHSFTTATDSEVLLAAYAEWGPACVQQFNGMWAFAIYNETDKTVFLSRDRFGKKPLYYSFFDKTLLFCSEIKGILAVTGCAKLQPQVALHYLVYGQVDASNNTFFDGIEQLPAAHHGFFDLTTGSFRITRYYKLEMQPHIRQMHENEVVDLFGREFERAVTWRLRSDVRVGVGLSGGLDSSSVAAVAAGQFERSAHEPLTAIIAASTHPHTNELPFAQQVVQHCNLQGIVTKPTASAFLQALEDVVRTQEEPFESPSVFMQYFVMLAAAENGVVVMLNGQGADEVLRGYLQHLPPYLADIPWPQKARMARQVMAHNHLSAWQLLKLQSYFANQKLRRAHQRQRWQHLKPALASQLFHEQPNWKQNEGGSIFARQVHEICRHGLPALLRYEDKNAMRFSVESRLPFLDYRLVEMALSANDAYKIKDGWSKNILRRAMQGKLPDSIVWRNRKIGFAAPPIHWLQHQPGYAQLLQNSPLLRLFFSKPVIPQNESMLWRMLCMAVWEKVYNVTG
jgi:asparagine synthase (glutamine-hydrolysing)